jgi:hypothetical protein
MTSAGVSGVGKTGEKYALVQANRERSAVERFDGRSRSPLACGDGDLPLPKPVKGATLAAKLMLAGGFRFTNACG